MPAAAPRSPERARGVYYTPPAAALHMAHWALRDGAGEVLEPSVGDGAFLRALQAVGARCGRRLRVHGVELSRRALRAAIERGLVAEADAIRADFLAVRPFEVDAVVGNPPYVRLRHLPSAEARRALAVAEQALGRRMDPSGSLWMAFVAHAARFVRPGGRLALVLPYEVTYVRYARPLWQALGERFGELRVVRVRERIFPELAQEAVIVFAAGRGARTGEIRFEVFEREADLPAGRPAQAAVLELAELLAGRRVFLEALLAPPLRELLAERVAPATVRVEELADVRIGYVAGDKEFFHPSPETVERFGIAPESLRPALASGRRLRGAGVRTSRCEPDRLFSPGGHPGAMAAGDRGYVAHGEATGVSRRYKCRVREPWYRVPGVRVAEVVFPVFAQRPLALLNDGGFAVSNSLLCAHLRRPAAAPGFVVAWYSSLTALEMELRVHALGGGVLVLVPREVAAIRVPRPRRPPRGALETLDRLLAEGRVQSAFEWGDAHVLAPALGLSGAEVAAIREGADRLAGWRVALRSPPPTSESG